MAKKSRLVNTAKLIAKQKPSTFTLQSEKCLTLIHRSTSYTTQQVIGVQAARGTNYEHCLNFTFEARIPYEFGAVMDLYAGAMG